MAVKMGKFHSELIMERTKGLLANLDAYAHEFHELIVLEVYRTPRRRLTLIITECEDIKSRLYLTVQLS